MNEITTAADRELLLKIPGGNRTRLTSELAHEFRSFARKAKGDLIEMSLLAEGVRNANKNASGDYNKNFHDWYAKNSMDEVFGSKSNFSKYATAGTAIVRHKNVLGRKIEELPLSISALYAIHDMTDEEATLCLEDHYTRTDASIGDKSKFRKKSKKPQPVINPAATAASISSWLKRWRNPPLPVTDKRRLTFMTIRADSSVYEFAKDGAFKGHTTVDQLEAIERKIRDAISGEGSHVLIESKLHDLKRQHEKKKNSALDAASKKKTKGSK